MNLISNKYTMQVMRIIRNTRISSDKILTKTDFAKILNNKYSEISTAAWMSALTRYESGSIIPRATSFLKIYHVFDDAVYKTPIQWIKHMINQIPEVKTKRDFAKILYRHGPEKSQHNYETQIWRYLRKHKHPHKSKSVAVPYADMFLFMLDAYYKESKSRYEVEPVVLDLLGEIIKKGGRNESNYRD